MPETQKKQVKMKYEPAQTFSGGGTLTGQKFHIPKSEITLDCAR